MNRLIIIFLLFCSSRAYSQTDKTVDVLSLKDGSVFVGKFINVTDSTYLFSTPSVDSITVDKSQVLNISFDVKNYSPSTFKLKSRKVNLKRKVYKTDGYFVFADFGMVSGQEVHWHSSITFGKRVTPRFYLGLQGGKENVVNTTPFIWQTDGIWSIGAYGRFYPFADKLKPFVSARLGYGFVDDKNQTEKSGGLNIVPGIGLRFPSRNGFHFIVSAHQYFLNTRGTSQFDNGSRDLVEVNYDIWYNRTVIKIGVEF